MQKTYCDRPGCGRECVNYVLNLFGEAVHMTNRGEVLGEGERVKQLQLCVVCSEELTERFGLTLAPVEPYPLDDMPVTSVAIAGQAEARAHP
jgi:hypothetical protein